MLKEIICILCLIIIFGIHVPTMIYGWGLQPENWGWIIGGFIANILILGLMEFIKKN